MMNRSVRYCFASLTLAFTLLSSPAQGDEAAIASAVDQLRHAVGTWEATSEFLKPDGSVARTVVGTYEFEWVVEDRVVMGRSIVPELDQVSGILFYVEPAQDTIEMVSVGADGHLWVMTGPAGSEVRTTPPTKTPDGSTIQLRFTRYNVEPDRFESKMEVSNDEGATWLPGNHQVMVRLGDGIESAATELTWESLPAWLDAEAAAGFTGAVLVVREGEVVVDRGYGLANRELGIANTPETIFAVGSQPIDFTHAAILWLAQQGQLALDDPITDYFQSVPPDKQAITIEHLMTGGSGLPDFHDVPTDRDPDHSWIDRDEAMRRIFAQDLLFPPGEGDEHSHSAWGVLAAIVEIASGQSYQDFTRQHLFAPAGMSDTNFNGDSVAEERLAIGYGMRSDGEVNAPPYWGETSWLVMGSGGQTSTTLDTGRWLTAMREGRILEPEWAERFFGPGPGANRNGDVYGFEMFLFHGPMAGSYAVLITNANNPEEAGSEDTHFVEVSRAVGDLVLAPYRPKFSLGISMGQGPPGAVEVEEVRPGSAADRDGLRAGDLLLSANGVGFSEDPMAVLAPYLASGDAILFAVERAGKSLEITVRPDPRENRALPIIGANEMEDCPMKIQRISLVCALAAMACAAMPIVAQEEAPSAGAAYGRNLEFVGGRAVQLAEAIPAEAYGWRPMEGVRSVSEAVMHMASANYFFAGKMGVAPPEGLDVQGLEAITDQAECVKTLAASNEQLAKAFAGIGDSSEAMDIFGRPGTMEDLMLIAIGHVHEHFGQLIAYARANKIAPPWSAGEG